MKIVPVHWNITPGSAPANDRTLVKILRAIPDPVEQPGAMLESRDEGQIGVLRPIPVWRRTRTALPFLPTDSPHGQGNGADIPTPMDRLAAIEAFVRVAETKSFSEAAKRLGSSKSAVSRHVSALETELGARLFHRTTRSLTLTEAGR
eukprot:gene27354-30218_t